MVRSLVKEIINIVVVTRRILIVMFFINIFLAHFYYGAGSAIATIITFIFLWREIEIAVRCTVHADNTFFVFLVDLYLSLMIMTFAQLIVSIWSPYF